MPHSRELSRIKKVKKLDNSHKVCYYLINKLYLTQKSMYEEGITKEEFLAYEKVRTEGKTNMFNIAAVVMLSDYILNFDDCLDIMKNYSNYKSKYL